MPRLRPALVIFLAITILALLSALTLGCRSSRPQVRTRLSPVIVPSRADITPARVGIFAFRSPVGPSQDEEYSAYRLQQLLLTRRVARMVEVIPESYLDLDEAIDRARILGYDVAVLGQLQELFYGGDSETSKATVDLRLVDTVRRVTIWYLSSTARAAPSQARDYLLFRTDGSPARTPRELIDRCLVELSDRLVSQAKTVPPAESRPDLEPSEEWTPPEIEWGGYGHPTETLNDPSG